MARKGFATGPREVSVALPCRSRMVRQLCQCKQRQELPDLRSRAPRSRASTKGERLREAGATEGSAMARSCGQSNQRQNPLVLRCEGPSIRNGAQQSFSARSRMSVLFRSTSRTGQFPGRPIPGSCQRMASDFERAAPARWSDPSVEPYCVVAVQAWTRALADVCR